MDAGEQRRAWLDRRQFLLTASRFLQLGHKPRHIRKALHLSGRQFRKAVQHNAEARRLMREIQEGLNDPKNYVAATLPVQDAGAYLAANLCQPSS